MGAVSFEIESGVGRLHVDRPDFRNALNWDAQNAFAEAIAEIAVLDDLQILVITGVGQAFLAGGDIHELQAYSEGIDGLRLATIMGDALNELERLPCLTVAQINGPARGGGAEVSIACDIRLMSTEASIAFVHTRLGLIPGWGGLERLNRLVGYSRALELLATGQVLNAEHALSIGLVNQTAVPDQLGETLADLVHQVRKNDFSAIRAVKRTLQNMQSLDKADARLLEREVFVRRWKLPERKRLFENALPKKKNSE